MQPAALLSRSAALLAEAHVFPPEIGRTVEWPEHITRPICTLLHYINPDPLLNSTTIQSLANSDSSISSKMKRKGE
ncbi:hypothetical protein [Bradyrhizobium sp. I1.7.5]|uniref:hypothetical protein n=1 Tax=Bradyrhizobium sp. I1.7.5 TaxID=3156363 RepID=UPI003395A407